MKPVLTSLRKIVESSLRALALPSCLLLCHAAARADASLLVYDFGLGQDPVANADYVQSLGFGGLVTSCSRPSDLVKLAAYAGHTATMEDFRLLAYVDYDFADPDSATVWQDALPVLASAGSPLWVIVENAPSPVAVRRLLRRMARASQVHGVRTVIYPHWNTDIESAAEAAAIMAEVNHPNLGNSIHTCHEIRSGNQYGLPAVVAAHAAGTELVTIAGADDDAYAGPPPTPPISWDDAIKPLDEGGYSLLPFLQALSDAGYDGPVILHTFGITGNPGHLERSLSTYDRYLLHVH